ncbi:hypothetical protein [Pseudarthrobacter sp. BIM B-2242]|uniref:hypothetical protein n=1 Tax=Pseudarthrobacter sp. BIM B-2242 TaxID=2772401 RepID=UPI00168B7455|nr:hypothetical protein [Pseudarthrobacter sp. BIM B-2242]QOD02550.1 hypothetical protein IDT60_14475 [Pseudarthrobacter sp. BIM B-2242]
MTHIMSSVPAQATFGRDSALFEGLVDFVAQLSVALWALVILTVVVRFVGIWMYRRGADRKARVVALTPIAAVVPTVVPVNTLNTLTTVNAATKDTVPAAMALKETVHATIAGKDAVHTLRTDVVTPATFDQLRQPDEAPAVAATSVQVSRRSLRHWRSERRTATHVPALAANSTEG